MFEKCCWRFRFKASANRFVSAKNSPKVKADAIIVSVNQLISDRCYTEGDNCVPSHVLCHEIMQKVNCCSVYWNGCVSCVSDRKAGCGGSVFRPVWWTTSAAAAGGPGRTSAGMKTAIRMSWVGGGFERWSCQNHIIKWIYPWWLEVWLLILGENRRQLKVS